MASACHSTHTIEAALDCFFHFPSLLFSPFSVLQLCFNLLSFNSFRHSVGLFLPVGHDPSVCCADNGPLFRLLHVTVKYAFFYIISDNRLSLTSFDSLFCFCLFFLLLFLPCSSPIFWQQLFLLLLLICVNLVCGFSSFEIKVLWVLKIYPLTAIIGWN